MGSAGMKQRKPRPCPCPLGTTSLGDSSRTLMMMTMMIMVVEVVKVMLGSVGLEGMVGMVEVVPEGVMKRRRILVHLEVIIRMIPTMKTMKIAVMKRKMRKWRRREGRKKGRK